MDIKKQINTENHHDYLLQKNREIAHLTKSNNFIFKIGIIILICLFLLPLIVIFIPWSQVITGTGYIVGYTPQDRIQILTSSISGRVTKWLVWQGMHVKKGQLLLVMEDNDKNFEERLVKQRTFLFDRLRAVKSELYELKLTVDAAIAARNASINSALANKSAAEKEIEVSRLIVSSAGTANDYEKYRYNVIHGLLTNNTIGAIESKISGQEALMRADRAALEQSKAYSLLERSKADLSRQSAEVLQIDAKGLSDIAIAKSNFYRCWQNISSIEQEIQTINTDIQRFHSRNLISSCDGTILNVYADGNGGQYVTEGTQLCSIVPDTKQQVVELNVKIRDVSYILAYFRTNKTAPLVRLQFEGWPAFVLPGMLYVSKGIFGGKVIQVNPAADENGNISVIVAPDEQVRGDKWPDSKLLRQGTRAIGWIILDNVSLAYEAWRRLNDLPPIPPPLDISHTQNSNKTRSKLLKIKLI